MTPMTVSLRIGEEADLDALHDLLAAPSSRSSELLSLL